MGFDLIDLYKATKPQKFEKSQILKFRDYLADLMRNLGLPNVSDEELVKYIVSLKTDTPEKGCRYHLAAGIKTIEIFLKKYNSIPPEGRREFFHELSYDLYRYVDWAEQEIGHPLRQVFCKNFVPEPKRVFYTASCSLYRIKENTLYLGSVFFIRQALELLKNNLLGIEEIKNDNGRPYSNHTIFWDFLIKQEEIGHIGFPSGFDSQFLIKSIKWCNKCVHQGVIPRLYFVEVIINYLQPLFNFPADVEDGQHSFQLFVELEKFRSEFENSIVQKKNLIWNPISKDEQLRYWHYPKSVV